MRLITIKGSDTFTNGGERRGGGRGKEETGEKEGRGEEETGEERRNQRNQDRKSSLSVKVVPPEASEAAGSGQAAARCVISREAGLWAALQPQELDCCEH